MSAPRGRSLLLWAAPGTGEEAERRLRRAGVRTVRLASLAPAAVAPSRWLRQLPPPPKVDTILTLSRFAIAAGLEVWRRRTGASAGRAEHWAAGRDTAAALRAAGVRNVRVPATEGAEAVRQALRRRRPRTVVYFRSDKAGPTLARALRADGHRVSDPVVYRLGDPPTLGPRARTELFRATVVLVTSPSGLSSLRRRLGPSGFVRFRQKARLAVLGLRSLRAARGHGFRSVVCLRAGTAQRLTHELLRALDDARG